MNSTNYPEFVPFPKIPRLYTECVITEKIDGTNGIIYITDDGDMFIGSRNRWLSAESDNFGFHRWASENENELMKLGPGRHHGEWWGSGIQRGYNLPKGEKRFSLFNVNIWNAENTPECCYVVPTLYTGEFDTTKITVAMVNLLSAGSLASPGFMNPEGVMIFHSAANHYFKAPFDENHKG
ncbi:MAG: RNA ligase family protein [Anaerolineaceae bacterium]|nr:RNA ligase family protein [Anaerolineaceae bacterium]